MATHLLILISRTSSADELDFLGEGRWHDLVKSMLTHPQVELVDTLGNRNFKPQTEIMHFEIQ